MASVMNGSLRLIRMKELRSFVGLGHAQIYVLIAADKFPKPVHISERAVGWRSDEIEQWIKARNRVKY